MERILHGVNVGGCCLQMVTGAVEMASTGGALTAVGAGLSALALRRAPDQQREIAERMAEALEAHLGRTGHTEALQRQLVLILDGFTVGPQDIARGDVNAEKIAGLMRARVMAEAIMPEHREEAVLDAYEAMLHATLLPLCTPHTQTQANDQEMLARLTELTQLVKSQNADQPLRDAGIREAVILDLARKASGSTDNLAQAWTDLTAFFEAALQVQEQAPATNHDDFVDEVIARTRDLAKQGDYGSALDALEEALSRDAEEQAAQQAAFEARTARLKQRQQNLLVLSAPEEAAAFLIAQADRTAGGSADVPDLRALQEEYYERGRDKGLAADLLIAIELSNATLPRAGTPDARGKVLNDLGSALQTLGARDSGTARLEEAVQAYRDALLEFTRERVPLDWAGTQNNLGNVLQTLGERESDTARLEEAVQAYRDALLEWSRERVPLYWAGTQNNLGAALQTLGERDSGTARLEEAVQAYRDALLEFTRERVPLDWAATQNNLGTALRTLGERDSGTARLEEAVQAYRDAMLERTRERVPLDWAATQNNLGTVLQTLGARDSGTARLEEAVKAYRDALLERTRERVPLDWAMTQNNLGYALRTLGERDSGTARLEEAVQAFRDALLERTRERVPLDWAATQNNLGTVLQTLGQRDSAMALLEEAVRAYRDALLERTRERVPLDWAMTQNNLGYALQTLGTCESDTARLEEAVKAYRDALLERTRERVPLDWAGTQFNLSGAELVFFHKTGDVAHLDAAARYLAPAREVFAEAGATQYLAMCDQISGIITARRG